MLISNSSFAYEYHVQEEDNLSTILNSIGEYKEGDLKKEIKSHSKKNKLKSPDLIQKYSTLELTPTYSQREVYCNMYQHGNSIYLKNKITNRKKPKCKDLINFTLITGRKTYRLNNHSPSFRGELSTKSLKGYELSVDTLKGKNSLKIHHSLHIQDYQRVDTLNYDNDSHILPSFGISYMRNNDIASPFISLRVGKEVFISEKDVNNLILEDKFVTKLNLGYQFKIRKLKLSPSARLSSHDRGANIEADYSLSKHLSLMVRTGYQKRDSEEERGLTLIGLRLKD